MSPIEAGPLHVISPLPGRTVALTDVPDPVFSSALVGDGMAVVPHGDAVILTALAPIDGRVVKVMPHAFVIRHETGAAVLVHVGIDTVHLKGEGFTVHAAKNDDVSVGDPMVSVDVPLIRSRNLDPCCPVVVLDTKAGTIREDEAGRTVDAGELLFTVPATDIKD